MSLRALALDWSLDGQVGTSFLVLVVAVGALYLVAAARGHQRDRRRRRWPWRRTALFLGGLAALVIDLYSGIGTEADVRLSVHMVEHMVMWVVVAPLLAAGAPVRLAFFALPRDGRRRLARWMHSPAASALTRPTVTVMAFSGVLLLSHVPSVYGLTLRNDYVHEIEHGLYLFTAVLMWASILRVDPLPHRPSARGELACMIGCMLPMAMIALWLGTARDPVYGHYLGTLGGSALADQRLAATIMWFGGLPAFAVPALARMHARYVPRREEMPLPSANLAAAAARAALPETPNLT
jgi:cytochrome c oxidase assembly factor CtaG